jgi:plastocyanin
MGFALTRGVRPSMLALFLVGLLAGCGIGEITGPGSSDDPDGGAAGDDDDDDDDDVVDPGADAAVADYLLSVDPLAASTTLNTTTAFTVSVESQHFAGPVSLTATGLPASWQVTFSPSATVNLVEDGAVTVTMTVIVPSNGAATVGALAIGASAAPGARSAGASLTVDDVLVMAIAPGTGDGPHAWPPTLDVNVGTTIRFSNGDSAVHQVHSDNGGAGFPHGDPLGPGDSAEVTITTDGELPYYCHEHNQAGLFRFLASDPDDE